MRRQDDRTLFITPTLRAVLEAPGVELERSLRRTMEAQLGFDFGRVRLHLDGPASASATTLGARAYAIGSHLVFAEGRYAPETRAGLWLLAHELAHVVQQCGKAMLAGASHSAVPSLERAADWAADIVVAGGRLPPSFALGVAPCGAIQFHLDAPCLGTPAPGGAGAPEISTGANESIRVAYLAARPGSRNSVLFGDDFLEVGRQTAYMETQLPAGAKNKTFGDYLLQRLRGIFRQRRPDIIDFKERQIYEVKTVRYAQSGAVQLQSYNEVAEVIRQQYNHDVGGSEPPWRPATAGLWYPPHTLPLAGASSNLFVCTQATDYTRPRQDGLILYDIYASNRRRRQNSHQIQLEAFDHALDSLAPMVRAQLPKTIATFDPDSPDYIIIAPQEFYSLDFVKQRSAETLERMNAMVRAPIPTFLDPHQPFGLVTMGTSYAIAIILGPVAAAGVIFCLILAPSAAIGAPEAVAAAGVTVAETGATTAATEAVVGSTLAEGLPATVATPAEMTARLVAQMAAMNTTAAVQSALSSEAALTALRLAAGTAVLVAGSGVAGATPSKATLKDPIVVRAIALDKFQLVSGILYGSSNDRLDSGACFEASKVFVGTKVIYDNKPYFVLGRCSVK